MRGGVYRAVFDGALVLSLPVLGGGRLGGEGCLRCVVMAAGLFDGQEYTDDERERDLEHTRRRRLPRGSAPLERPSTSQQPLHRAQICKSPTSSSSFSFSSPDAHIYSTLHTHPQTTSIVLSNTVQEYLIPANRQASYSTVRPKRLQALLEKLAKYATTKKDGPSRELGERRRKEAEAVGRLFPGESR